MKKMLLILSLFIVQMAPAQKAIGVTGTVVITSVWPVDYQCIGDSAIMNFTFKFSGTSETVPSWGFFFSYDGSLVDAVIRDMSYGEIFACKKQFNGTDTIYTFKYLVPASLPPTQQILIAVRGNASTNISAKNSGLQYCHLAGIEEYNQNDKTPVYFSLYDPINPIEPRKNEIMIMRIGNGPGTKILIQE